MFKLIKYNIKLIFSYNMLAACILICMTPIFFQLSNMNFSSFIKMGELYLSLSGIFLFISLGCLEIYKNTWEFVYIQKISYIKICLVRVLLMMLFNAILILIPVTYVYLKSDYLQFPNTYFGFVVTAWFLGLLGLLITEISLDYKAGYIVTLAYYFIETSTKGIFKKFQVFGYLHNIAHTKEQVFLCCLVIIILYLIVIKEKGRHGII